MKMILEINFNTDRIGNTCELNGNEVIRIKNEMKGNESKLKRKGFDRNLKNKFKCFDQKFFKLEMKMFRLEIFEK